MFEKRLAEINERCAQILKEIQGEVTEERLTELETEQRSLESEKDMIQRKMDLSGKLGEPEPKAPEGPEGNDEEARAAKVKESGKMSLEASEVRNYLGTQSRSTLIATDSLAKPTKTGSTIHDKMGGVSSIVDQVYVTDLTGCASFEEPYVATEAEASERTDGSANTESDPTFRVSKIEPVTINVTSYVSKNIVKLTPVMYEEKVKTLALKALRSKIAKMIVNGNGSNFFGIKTAKNTKGETICDKITVAEPKITATTLRDIVFSYGGSEEIGANARLFLTKEDLAAFGTVRGTNEKKPVYEITADPANANCGTIKDGGTIVPYTINSGLTSLSTASKGASEIQTMVYGDPANFELGLFGNYEVEVSRDYKFAEGLLTIMGEVLAGGNVIVDKGFVVVELAKS